jgi:RimJ/RimL family protein N-acetyltransferase
MRPELVGQGRGREFVGAILTHVVQTHPPARLRMSILSWNGRSRRVAEGHGFRVTGHAGEFDVLVREAPRTADGEEYRPA